MTFSEPVKLGRTGLRVGRLGISSSYGAPAAAFEAAFEKGCNYFTWGTFIKGRSSEMKKAMQNIIRSGQREKLIVAILSYAHIPWLTDHYFVKGLQALGTDYADVLLLGYYSSRPSARILEGAARLREKGLVRHLGITSHNRKLFAELDQDGIFDVYHIRYNAAHRGAEVDTFPHLSGANRSGIVAFTATRWGQLLNPKKMPTGETALSPVDCYRFALSNPMVDVCMVGARSIAQMNEDLKTLETGPLSEAELIRIKRIGDYVYKRQK